MRHGIGGDELTGVRARGAGREDGARREQCSDERDYCGRFGRFERALGANVGGAGALGQLRAGRAGRGRVWTGGGPVEDSRKRVAAEDKAVEQQDNLNLQEMFDLQNNMLQELTEDEDAARGGGGAGRPVPEAAGCERRGGRPRVRRGGRGRSRQKGFNINYADYI